MFDRTAFSKVPLLRHSLVPPAWVASRFLGDATVFATIVEDFPYPHNRVIDDPSTPSGMRFEYRIDDDLRSRVEVLRRSFRDALGELRTLPLSLGVNLNFGHPCGTCRAGKDPSESVVAADGSAHGLENLFVVDASFMPTSGGTNPSLTIAANAMRIADRVRELL
jgi:choline dehydrogenase-like flavoprotein